ncbi:MAG: hypothetical protein WBY66_24995, partial [Candidatus Acidiferrales bacterium]
FAPAADRLKPIAGERASAPSPVFFLIFVFSRADFELAAAIAAFKADPIQLTAFMVCLPAAIAMPRNRAIQFILLVINALTAAVSPICSADRASVAEKNQAAQSDCQKH